jgi:uncharacterized protein Yka (UPF0111/DUF47 family)
MNTNLFHRTFPFTELFQKQTANLEEAVKQLESALHDGSAIPAKCERISALVAEGDATSRQIERELALTFIQPLDREDIRELNRALRRTIQAVGGVSSRLSLCECPGIPKGAAAHTACLAQMVAELAPLLEIVVRKKDGAVNCEKVRKRKQEADAFLLDGLREVYESTAGGVPNLLEAMKWGQVFDRLEQTAASLEHTVNVIEGIILKKP